LETLRGERARNSTNQPCGDAPAEAIDRIPAGGAYRSDAGYLTPRSRGL
jgi:hypothetical protein